ncbi:MAG: TolB family protein, partial [Actinomycetes bacterium]
MMNTTANDQVRRPVVPEDLFALRFLMGADLSPDGTSVVYALSRTDLDANTDHTDLFVLDIASGKRRRLTHTNAVHASPTMSPDGSQVAFLSTRAGLPQISVLPLTGGEARQVTELPRGVGGGPVWSPDGTRLAFTAGDQGPPRDPTKPYRVSRTLWRADAVGLVDDAVQDVYVVAASGGEPRQLTDDAWLTVNPVWTHDGTGIVYTAAYDPDSGTVTHRLRQVTVTDPVDISDSAVTELAGGGIFTHVSACPDGRVAYVMIYEDGQLPGTKADLWVLDPATGIRERRTADLDVGVAGVIQSDMPSIAALLAPGKLVISDDARHAFAPVQRGGEVGISRIALSGPE